MTKSQQYWYDAGFKAGVESVNAWTKVNNVGDWPNLPFVIQLWDESLYLVEELEKDILIIDTLCRTKANRDEVIKVFPIPPILEQEES